MDQSSATHIAVGHARKKIAALRQELIAGTTVALVMLPVCMASGVLVYGQLGPSFLTQGILSGMYGAVFAAIISALLASSSFIATTPVPSIVIIPAALVGDLIHNQAFATHPQLIVVAVSLCVLLAGILQALFGLLHVGRIMTFAPHPVIAGFLNSVAMVIIFSQLHLFLKFGVSGRWLFIDRAEMLAFVLAVAAFVVGIASVQKKVPAPLVGLFVGTSLYYLMKLVFPALNLGLTIGVVPLVFPPASPLFGLADESTRAAIVSVVPHLLFVSVTLAVVATLQSLLTFRATQNVLDLPPRPPRDLIAQGVGNCAAALAGGLAAVPPPMLTTLAFRSGGRTRVTPIAAGMLILLATLFLPSALALIPLAVLSGILVSIGYQLFDRWSIRLFKDLISNRRRPDRRAGWQNICVIAIVMLVSALSSIVVGVFAGFVLACLIFMVEMSRPVVRRCLRGDEVFSKRARSTDDIAILRRTGSRRVALELQGVLFFGNADDLSKLVEALLSGCDMILFDLRGISDIDVSGATILTTVVARCLARGKKVFFCNVPTTLGSVTFTGRASAVLPDLDTGLERMEEETLRTATEARSRGEPIPLDALDLVKDLDLRERNMLTPLLIPRTFACGAVVCTEGEDADRMWIISKGSVSVRLDMGNRNDTRRIASIGPGTTVGEMALLEGGTRSATVVCDDDVASYELSRASFDALLRDHPLLARKLYTYFAQQMVQRIRILHGDLRALTE
jgi:sulfate permease, SulP family